MKTGKFFPKISYDFFKEQFKKLDRAFWRKYWDNFPYTMSVIVAIVFILILAFASLNRLTRWSFVTNQKKIERIETEIKAGKIKTVRINKIPERFIQIPSRVEDMEINDTCWINYIQIDSSHNVWIDPREWIYPQGRAKIIRSDSGFIVDLSYCPDYQWLMINSSLDKIGYYPAYYIIVKGK